MDYQKTPGETPHPISTPKSSHLDLPPVDIPFPSGKFLAYTVAFDTPNSPGHRSMARMLGSSLLRTLFDGDFVIFRNSPRPIFPIRRSGIEEYYIETPEIRGHEGSEYAWCWKYLVRSLLPSNKYDKVIFLDADSLILRNIDHLLTGAWDIAYQTERSLPIDYPQFSCFISHEDAVRLNRSGINSGTLAVRGSIYQKVMAEWERIDTGPTVRERGCSDQGSWNKLVVDADSRYKSKKPGCMTDTSHSDLNWRCREFERGEVQFPMHLDQRFLDYTEAAIVHCLGGDTREKLRFMYGLYMNTFYFDDNLILLNLLEM